MSTLELIVKDLEALPPAKLNVVAEFIHQLKKMGRDKKANKRGRSIPETVFAEAMEHVMTHHAPLMKKLAS